MRHGIDSDQSGQRAKAQCCPCIAAKLMQAGGWCPRQSAGNSQVGTSPVAARPATIPGASAPGIFCVDHNT